jgi:hypothetical protein
MHHPWQKKLIKLQTVILQVINAPYSPPQAPSMHLLQCSICPCPKRNQCGSNVCEKLVNNIPPRSCYNLGFPLYKYFWYHGTCVLKKYILCSALGFKVWYCYHFVDFYSFILLRIHTHVTWSTWIYIFLVSGLKKYFQISNQTNYKQSMCVSLHFILSLNTIRFLMNTSALSSEQF